MKMMLIETLALTGAMSLIGYMYMKKHPEKMEKVKESIKDMSRTIYNKLDNENM